MKIILFLLPILGFCQIQIPYDYTKIPDSLYFRDSLYQFIAPNKKYDNWKVIRRDDTLVDELIYEYKRNDGQSCKMISSISNGFFYECSPTGCFTFILACRNSHMYTYNTENELKAFIGYIDNLSEALLIARTHGFWFDNKDLKGGSYKITKNYIFAYLAKFESFPVRRESFFIKINRKTGELQQESKGMYYPNM